MPFDQGIPIGLVQDGKPPMKSLIGRRIMALLETDPEAFEREAKAYFALGYPGFTIVRFENPLFYLQDDRP